MSNTQTLLRKLCGVAGSKEGGCMSLAPMYLWGKGWRQAMAWGRPPNVEPFSCWGMPPFSTSCREKSRATCEQSHTQQMPVGSWAGLTLWKKGGHIGRQQETGHRGGPSLWLREATRNNTLTLLGQPQSWSTVCPSGSWSNSGTLHASSSLRWMGSRVLIASDSAERTEENLLIQV